MKRVTIQDIARELNLSRNTVSKALRDSDQVSYETKCMVIKKAYEMGYTKLSPAVLKQSGLSTVSDKIKTVVVLLKREISLFWNSIIMGISEELNRCGFKLQLNFISEEDEKNLVLPLDLEEDVSGIIILSVFSQNYIEKILKQNIPTVFLDAPGNVETIAHHSDIVLCEGINSVKAITSDLISRGMKKIGFIGDITYCRTINDRYQGYLKALEEAGIEADNSIIAAHHVKNRYYAAEEVEAALDGFPYIPEAIVCANDDIALDVIRYLKSRGVSVPGDVAVTGYDDIEDLTRAEPFLTTVRVPKQRLGRRLVQQLMWRMQYPDFPKEIVIIEVQVIFRESSKKNI
ncbi:HTH-type transcriptional repressor PurR [Thermoclostridium stercorarium subsp. stercorarium DSM 8532]|uniref:HTH-type transcriptional repressor PurR n=2 Tax=Thermoclostridium stercorarium TaxID=1510 RepID=L7VJ88_THES1|nr:LacI family DNA-binding transcriptional regulator [Thermoclostridium stercorarium]AGC68120.1 HTH-type transcriptional repressor PurR [Thermoclostridium stercorarium subsp. stercorarium DSM 8532]AGI39146.1 transcriptional regulator [Thermoclostridium stercorarium subsp. stercorarium DSM 8532]ANW98501.1 LacI family transcriptional regulator [Thermoclostridium stercorarium subsp. thermolacticum DSM 2910]UZQ86647.1 LacI family DNA-binding transcriptional regulator [Thermoclostridium stercorarium